MIPDLKDVLILSNTSPHIPTTATKSSSTTTSSTTSTSTTTTTITVSTKVSTTYSTSTSTSTTTTKKLTSNFITTILATNATSSSKISFTSITMNASTFKNTTAYKSTTMLRSIGNNQTTILLKKQTTIPDSLVYELVEPEIENYLKYMLILVLIALSFFLGLLTPLLFPRLMPHIRNCFNFTNRFLSNGCRFLRFNKKRMNDSKPRCFSYIYTTIRPFASRVVPCYSTQKNANTTTNNTSDDIKIRYSEDKTTTKPNKHASRENIELNEKKSNKSSIIAIDELTSKEEQEVFNITATITTTTSPSQSVLNDYKKYKPSLSS